MPLTSFFSSINRSVSLKIVLIAFTVVVIALLCPRERGFDIQFEEGQQWQYEDLVAPRDIPLLKLDEEIEMEQEAITAEFLPFYFEDDAVKSNNLAAFSDQFEVLLESVTSDSSFKDVQNRSEFYKSFAFEWLDGKYNTGIIAKAHADDLPVFNYMKRNVVSTKTFEDFISADSLESYIIESLQSSDLVDSDFLIPLILQHLEPNIIYSDSLTNIYLSAELDGIIRANGVITQGSSIINSGDYIGPSAYRRLYSYKMQEENLASSPLNYWLMFSGYVVLLGLLMTIFWIYLSNTMPKLLQDIRHLLFVLLLVVSFSYLTYAVESIEGLSAFLIPFAVVPMVVRIFYSDRLALFVHLLVVIIASLISKEGYQFTVVELIVGIAAILSKPNARNWNAFFKSILWIFAAYILAYAGTSLMQGFALQKINPVFLIWITLNALLCLMAFPLIPLLERLFGFMSDFTLVELSDLNHPLLKEMAEKGSGTLQHSLQVSNLAEAAAEQIGVNSLLIKVAALYHDIGKLYNPEYFIENQKSDNPHDKLSPLESAKIIIGHVPRGVEMAKTHKLPKPIISFIETHHGTTKTEYFYRTALNSGDEKVDPADFTYPGPIPFTKEQTILMLADSLEASSKSLKNPDAKDIDDLVERIIDTKIKEGQLIDSPLTFSELGKCKEVFKSRLKSMNHVRLEYPT